MKMKGNCKVILLVTFRSGRCHIAPITSEKEKDRFCAEARFSLVFVVIFVEPETPPPVGLRGHLQILFALVIFQLLVVEQSDLLLQGMINVSKQMAEEL